MIWRSRWGYCHCLARTRLFLWERALYASIDMYTVLTNAYNVLSQRNNYILVRWQPQRQRSIRCRPWHQATNQPLVLPNHDSQLQRRLLCLSRPLLLTTYSDCLQWWFQNLWGYAVDCASWCTIQIWNLEMFVLKTWSAKSHSNISKRQLIKKRKIWTYQKIWVWKNKS